MLDNLKLELSKVVLGEQQRHFAGISHCTLDSNSPPKNYKDVLSRPHKQDWVEAYEKEYLGSKDRNAFKVVLPKKGIRIHDSLARLELGIQGRQWYFKTHV